MLGIDNHRVGYLLLDEYQVSTVNHVINMIDNIIRKDNQDCKYIIKTIEIGDLGSSVQITIELLDTNIKLQYEFTKSDNEYVVEHINLPYYFADCGSLDSVFRDAILFVTRYTGGDEKSCKVLEFSYTSGDFLISILDSTNGSNSRLFKFKIEYGSDENIIWVNYYGEIVNKL